MAEREGHEKPISKPQGLELGSNPVISATEDNICLKRIALPHFL